MDLSDLKSLQPDLEIVHLRVDTSSDAAEDWRVIAKTTAFVFLIGGSMLADTPWSVWFSGLADGAMALVAYLVHRAVWSGSAD